MLQYRSYQGIGLLRGRYQNHRFAPHFHDHYSIAVILCGALAFRSAGDQHVAEPLRISAINPGEVHTGRPGAEAGWEYLHFAIPTECLAHFVPELGGAAPDIVRPVIADRELAQALASAHRAVHESASELARDTLMTEALGLLCSRYAGKILAEKPAARSSTRAAVDYIRANFADRIRLSELAEVARLSPYHFIRTFKRDTGLTPHAYQEQVRVADALRRLQKGLPAIEVANDVGYADQSHFIRALKRTYGMTPSLVQRAV